MDRCLFINLYLQTICFCYIVYISTFCYEYEIDSLYFLEVKWKYIGIHEYGSLLVTYLYILLVITYIIMRIIFRQKYIVLGHIQKTLEECPICKDDKHSNFKLETCSHIFCEECINTWVLNYQNSCPLCRKTVKFKKS